MRKVSAQEGLHLRKKMMLRLHMVYQPGAPKAFGFAVGGVPVETVGRSNPKIPKEFNHQYRLGSNGDTPTLAK
ncbi:hypothetical protein PVAP13_3KG352654 [Panicum virgatum]|uniref:Uncharacterized protein n=1 Tax=Panicum virgatum TaxID=38727 RepID=A0A8T0UYV1_PANVG|nr:hypothetical protein PVAP13_3KG352654 [Panicum virgatum]